MEYTLDDIKVGDLITLAAHGKVVEKFRGAQGTVVGFKKDLSGVLVEFVGIPNPTGRPYRIGYKNIAKVESVEPTQEEIDATFGIKKDEELRAEAEQLISICHSNILRLEARVLRLEAGSEDASVTDHSDAWKEVVVAKNEVKLARAAGLELEADYIERWGTQAHRKAFS